MDTTKRLQQGRKPRISRDIIALVSEEMGNDPIVFFHRMKERLKRKDPKTFSLLRLGKAPLTESARLYQAGVLMMIACLEAQDAIEAAPPEWRNDENPR